jgi:hypothetical protein
MGEGIFRRRSQNLLELWRWGFRSIGSSDERSLEPYDFWLNQ